MKNTFLCYMLIVLLLPCTQLFSQNQQLQMKDFVIYSAKELKLNDKTSIKPDTDTKGNIGSKESIKLKKGSTITANLFSRSTIDLDKEITIEGDISANNYKKGKW